jgi:hypothetical protein
MSVYGRLSKAAFNTAGKRVNMAALLESRTNEESSIVRFSVTGGNKPTSLQLQYGNACLTLQRVYYWSANFDNGVFIVTDTTRPSLHRHAANNCAV